MLSPSAVAIALPMMRRVVSPIPIGRTPGKSNAMRRQATKADGPLGLTKVVQCLRAVVAKASQRSAVADLNEVHSRFQDAVSRPDGPAAPSILRTVLRISCLSILSKKTGWGSVVCVSPVTIDDILAGC